MNKTIFFKNTMAQLKKLEHESDLIGWEIIENQKRSLQKLYSGDKDKLLVCHQERDVDEISYYLIVYTQDSEQGFMGTSSSDISPFSDVDEQIKRTIELSKNSKNKMWKLLEKPDTDYPGVITFDQTIKDNPEAVIVSIENEVVEGIKSSAGIYVNSAELYVNFTCILRETNTGIVTFKEKSDVYFEIAMEKAGRVNDKEVHENIESVCRKDLNIKSFVQECADQVNSLEDTCEPETKEDAVIIIYKEAIADLLFALIKQLDGFSEYMKFPYMKKNDRIYTGEKAPGSSVINMTLDPFIPEMTLSGGYTREGMVAEKSVIIKNDIVQTQLINNKYGQYLDKHTNGITGNIIIDPGEISHEDFKKMQADVLEIVKFSSLIVDQRKLTWSSEIKLAKQYHENGKISLIKGGVVSGKMTENFSHFYLSKETALVNSPGNAYTEPKGYKGPEKMLICSGVSIVGKE